MQRCKLANARSGPVGADLTLTRHIDADMDIFTATAEAGATVVDVVRHIDTRTRQGRTLRFAHGGDSQRIGRNGARNGTS